MNREQIIKALKKVGNKLQIKRGGAHSNKKKYKRQPKHKGKKDEN